VTASITRVIRKPIQSEDVDMSLKAFASVYVARSASCHHGNDKTYCNTCREVREMFRRVPSRGRALIGSGR